MGNKPVLLCDDDEIIRALGSRVLIKNGFEVITAENGLEAIRIFKKRDKEIEFVLLDLLLPDISGIEVLKAMKECNNNVKILLITGTIDTELIRAAEAAGINELIKKPFTPDQLIKAVNKVFKSEN